MQTEELAAQAPVSMTLGTIPTMAVLAFAAYGAGTAGARAGVVVTTLMRKRKARKTSTETQNHPAQ